MWVDVFSRKVLAHKVAITLEACHAREIIEHAFAKYGVPDIVNTDQGSQLGFKGSSQHRLLERRIVGHSGPLPAFSIRGSCEVFH